jgi:hypothetical protein
MHNFTTRKSTKTNKITYIFFLSVLWGDMYLYLTLSICSINIFATSYSHQSRIYIFLWLTNQVKILIGQANQRGTDASILSTSEFKYFVEIFSLALISWLTKIYFCQFQWLANNYDDASKGSTKRPYIYTKDAIDYSGDFPVSKVEPLWVSSESLVWAWLGKCFSDTSYLRVRVAFLLYCFHFCSTLQLCRTRKIKIIKRAKLQLSNAFLSTCLILRLIKIIYTSR